MVTTEIKLSLGPFQGITDVVFRNVYMRHFQGIDKLYTPFFTGIQKDRAKSLRTDEINPKLNDIENLTPQILSNDSTEIIRFASQCKDLGYKEINLNFGCPFQRVAKKKRGSGLLPYPQLIQDIFEKVFDTIDLKLSVKCRLGYQSDDEIFSLIEIYNQFPISELIVHARIGRQLYKGGVNVDRFSEIIPLVKAPLIYNGDIFQLSDYQNYKNIFPSIDTFMLGRGLLSNPFLASEIKGLLQISNQQKQHVVKQFVDDLFEERLRQSNQSPRTIGRMKELWTYLMWSFDEPQVVWRKIKKINDLKIYREVVDQVFQEHVWTEHGFTPSKTMDDLETEIGLE